jgi:bifunctional non-homologous end joining protein LigD
VGFDFDPVGDTWEQLVPLALAMRGLLESLKLKSFPKTSGKRGLHVLVPISPGPSHDDVVAFAVKLTEALANRFPKQATTLRPLTSRKGRLYLDAHQNGGLKTLVAPYSLRAVEGGPVSTPLEWDEVSEKLDPSLFNLRTVPKRIAKVGDLFAPVLTTRQALPDVK